MVQALKFKKVARNYRDKKAVNFTINVEDE